ncbi:hypothetical protein VTK73DRAFT_284 [Phialemonium thermophilum]|uniref:Uncharacterized protein n=1 Tax=Phialemonium thermophilum TaxID=223376 RepID=A0ABR3VW21_9PEZI
MSLSNPQPQVFLASYRDWESWSNQFRSRARMLQLWDYIQDPQKHPLREEPTYPVVTPEYQLTREARTRITRERARRRTATAPDAATRNPNQGMQPPDVEAREQEDPLLEVTLSFHDLSEAGHGSFALAERFFLYNYDCYKAQRKDIFELMDWVQSTVHLDIYNNCCTESDCLSEWYRYLTLSCGTSQEEEYDAAEQAYMHAIRRSRPGNYGKNAANKRYRVSKRRED